MPIDDPYIFVQLVQHTLATPQLTPLQVHEIDLASRMAETNPKDTGELQKQCEQIKKHWTAISSTAAQRGSTSNRLRILANNFVALLFEQYWDIGSNMSNVSLRDIVRALGSDEQRQTGADNRAKGSLAQLDRLYQRLVVFAIEELMLDRQHVEDRFRAALRGEKLISKSLHKDPDAGLRQLMEKDRATLHQFVLFFEYDKAEKRVPYDYIEAEFRKVSERLLKEPASASAAYSSPREGSSFWNLLGLGSPNARAGKLPAIARLLCSDEDIQKKSV